MAFYQMEIFSQNLIVSAERRVTANSAVTWTCQFSSPRYNYTL